ncbi:OmpA family protein [Breznakiella homolactica]|uniref:OmpA family protein n=2 Tax=Breznakiella homolactica TaxID=2798577 RepID=A0A7T7XRP9_9SPIR|nr:OmpA family protein [Breznakiella homolactica]
MTERSNWSRYDNGKYTGHVYREVRSSIIPEETEKDVLLYRGNFFVLEETLRDMRQSARAVDDVIPVSFQMFSDGTVRIDDDKGFPHLRGFPAFPAESVRPGTVWTARGARAVDPRNEGCPVVIPIVAQYEYRGVEEYKNIPVHRVFAKYASRYESSGGQSFIKLHGSHEVDILIRVSDGLPLLMRDTMDETYVWPDGSTIRFRGFTLVFGEGSIPLDREAVIASIGSTLGSSTAANSVGHAANGPKDTIAGSGDLESTLRDAIGQASGGPGGNSEGISDGGIEVSSVPEGIRLTVNDIRFEPDSDQILSEERYRLDLIAQVLRQIPERTFLVEGHTAAVGRPAGELELSLRRAKRIVEELSARGIPQDRFIYKGWGGTRPLGDNSSETGRQRNRRVEITILE